MQLFRKEFLSDDAMAGAFAGAVARLISAPFDVSLEGNLKIN